MKTTFFAWASACLSAVLLASGCATSRHNVTQAYRPTIDSEAIGGNNLKVTRETVDDSTGRDPDTVSAMPPLNPGGANNQDEIVAAAFAVEEPLVDVEAGSDDESALIQSVSNHNEISGWSLAQLEATALQQNPAILQASSSAQKAYGFRNQVGLKPNPVIGYQGQQLADAGTDQHLAFVEQDIVMGDKLRKNQSVLSQEIQSQLWEAETQRIRVITDVRQRFYEALAAQRRKELAMEFETVAAKGVRFAEARMRAKEGTRPEVLQAEIQLKEVQLQRQNADAAFRGAWTQLMSVAGMPHCEPGTLVGQLSVPADQRDRAAIQNQILSTSPELQGARARFARARANLDRQQSQAIPNLSLMVGAGQDNATGSGMVNTQVNIPLPVHNRNQGNIAAAHAEFCRASHDVRRTENAIQSRLAGARRDFEVSAATVLQYEHEILPRAKETLTLAESAYEAGEFDFLQVLIVRRTFFESNLAYVAAQVDFARSAALVDGCVLSGGLDATRDTEFDSGLRDQTLSGQ